MSHTAAKLRKRVFGISPAETSFARRGFYSGNAATRQHLERVGHTFLDGYDAALNTSEPTKLATQLDLIDLDMRGFAYEGAAMALALQDYLTPWQSSRIQAFIAGPGDAHIYMIYVGVGWALARLPWRVMQPMPQPDPLLKWLIIDGYGFHQGYFAPQLTIRQQRIPRHLVDYARYVFDQGVGRSLWFIDCADVERIGAHIAAFPPARRADLWSGVGLACAYAGGDASAVVALRDAGGSYAAHVAQGAAFAAKARQRAGTMTHHTDHACAILCGVPALAAAKITDHAAVQLVHTGALPAYETWRCTIRLMLAREVGAWLA